MSRFRETLAEAYLARGRPNRASHHYGQAIKVDKLIKMCLTPPESGQVLLRAPETAERYVFDEAPLDLVRQMVNAGTLDTHLMGEAVQLPASNTWFEFVDQEERERVGVLVRDPRDGKLLVALVLELDGQPTPVMMIEIKNLPWRFQDQHPTRPTAERGEYCEVLWEVQPYEARRTVERACHLMHDTLACLFLLCVPKICEVRQRVSRVERMRAGQPHSHPPVEFKHVKMVIGVGSPRYEGGAARQPGESLEDHRRRLHRVTWHFRTYRLNRDGTTRDKPIVTYVPEHWRGDASRGILLHTRTIAAAKKE